MALINCPQCGKPVSDRAAQCPHCGVIYPASQPGGIYEIAQENDYVAQDEYKNEDYGVTTGSNQNKWIWALAITAVLLAGIIATKLLLDNKNEAAPQNQIAEVSVSSDELAAAIDSAATAVEEVYIDDSDIPEIDYYPEASTSSVYSEYDAYEDDYARPAEPYYGNNSSRSSRSYSDDTSVPSWLEGNWRYSTTVMGTYYECRVGISGNTIVVMVNGQLDYSGTFTIYDNRLNYRKNGYGAYFVLDNANQRLMVDDHTPMYRF